MSPLLWIDVLLVEKIQYLVNPLLYGLTHKEPKSIIIYFFTKKSLKEKLNNLQY